MIYSRSWCGSGPPGTGHTSCHRSHKPSLWPNHKTFESGSSVSYAGSLAAFPRDCPCSGDNPGQDLSRISLPVIAFSASHGLQQPVPEERGVRPNRSEGNGPRKEPVAARSRVSDAHPASWVPHLQPGLAGKFRAGHDGGRWGDPRATDVKAGRREKVVGGEEGWGG